MSTMQSLPALERPRETLLSKGARSLDPVGLLAILIGSGRPGENALQLAGRLLAARGGIRGIASSTPEELLALEGLGPAKVARILAGLGLADHLLETKHRPEGPISGSLDLVAPYLTRYREARTEHFISILLDARNRITRDAIVSRGTLTESLVHPREAFAPALRAGAARVAFLHNHPSGDPTPSRCDVETTKRLVEAGKLLGIPVLDHCIIGDGCYVSLRDAGMWPREGS